MTAHGRWHSVEDATTGQVWVWCTCGRMFSPFGMVRHLKSQREAS